MLCVENLSFTFNNQKVINSINFTANVGEIIGIIGPNGAGKTTSMRLLSGCYTPESGRIIYDGIDLNQNAIKAKKIIGYLPEGAPLYGDMTTKEYLEYIANIHCIKKENIHEIIKKIAINTNLEYVFHQKIETLSKGFRRRIAFAAAAIHSPKYLILDEPMDGLDPNQKTIANETIKKLSKNSMILISTHVLEDIEAICTRIILLNNGNIIIDEAAKDFLKRNSNNFRQAFNQLTKEA